jgi:hypothetical protein
MGTHFISSRRSEGTLDRVAIRLLSSVNSIHYDMVIIPGFADNQAGTPKRS